MFQESSYQLQPTNNAVSDTRLGPLNTTQVATHNQYSKDWPTFALIQPGNPKYPTLHMRLLPKTMLFYRPSHIITESDLEGLYLMQT